MQTVNIFIAGLFIFGAGVQLNDPDPIGWIAIYLSGTVACIVAHYKPRLSIPSILVAVACVIWAATLAPDVISTVPFADMFGAWEMKNAGIEKSREMYGLLIIAAWMSVLILRAFRLKRS